jgi:hypothetical protein
MLGTLIGIVLALWRVTMGQNFCKTVDPLSIVGVQARSEYVAMTHQSER